MTAPDNRPVFASPGDYDPASFCFVVDEETSANARADDLSNAIHFNTGMFRFVRTDAEIAAILAHELAHITRQHGRTASRYRLNETQQKQLQELEVRMEAQSDALLATANDLTTRATAFSAYAEGQKSPATDYALNSELTALESAAAILLDLDKDPDWRQEAARSAASHLVGICETIRGSDQKQEHPCSASSRSYRSAIDAVVAASEAFEQSVKALQRFNDLTRSPEEADQSADELSTSQHQEQEADEFGLEYFLKAGFRSGHYLSMPLLIHRAMADEDNTINAFGMFSCFASQMIDPKKLPEKGDASHPTPCWRYFNLNAEITRHWSRYQEHFESNVLENLPGAPSLKEVKAEIKASANRGI